MIRKAVLMLLVWVGLPLSAGLLPPRGMRVLVLDRAFVVTSGPEAVRFQHGALYNTWDPQSFILATHIEGQTPFHRFLDIPDLKRALGLVRHVEVMILKGEYGGLTGVPSRIVVEPLRDGTSRLWVQLNLLDESAGSPIFPLEILRAVPPSRRETPEPALESRDLPAWKWTMVYYTDPKGDLRITSLGRVLLARPEGTSVESEPVWVVYPQVSVNGRTMQARVPVPWRDFLSINPLLSAEGPYQVEFPFSHHPFEAKTAKLAVDATASPAQLGLEVRLNQSDDPFFVPIKNVVGVAGCRFRTLLAASVQQKL